MSVFVVLGLLWAAVLVPPILRARSARRAEFIDSFQQQMGALGKKSREGRAASSPTRIQPAVRGPVALLARPTSPAKRRRDILGGLLGAMIGAFVLGLIPSLRSVWILLLFLVNLFLGYVALLAHNRRHLRRAQVRPAEAVLSPAIETWR